MAGKKGSRAQEILQTLARMLRCNILDLIEYFLLICV